MKYDLKKIAVVAAVGVASLTGCTVGPDYREPSFTIDEAALKAEFFARDGSLWKDAVPADSLPKGNWWCVFADTTLDALLKQCRANNPSLAAAFYRVEQARQAALMDEADLYPNLNANGAFSRQKASGNAYPYSGNTYNTYLAGLGLTWDIDLFGRVRSVLESDIAEAQSAFNLYNNLILSMQAQVASLYFSIRQYEAEEALLERTLDVRKEQTELVQRRVNLDFANDLDLQRALEQECEASAQLATVGRQLVIAKNQIAILVGITPSQLKLEKAALASDLPKLPRAVPSQLLERRPDVAAAERKVYAANALIGAAQAGFFPTVSLSADTSLSADRIDKILETSSFGWGVSPRVYIPIFQAGRIYAQKQVALSRHKEAVENYKATVLNAIGEVENALANINLLKTEYEKRHAVTVATQKVEALTKKQYDLGYVDYFSVSDAQRISLASERDELRLKAERFRACVSLIAALGGGWQQDPDSQEAVVPALYDSAKDADSAVYVPDKSE